MDPLSITVGAVSLAANVLRSAAYVKEAVDQFRDAPTLARDIEHEIKIVQAALRQVEATLQRDPQAISRLSLADIFELSVEGCRDTLQEITQEFETLFGRHDWRLKLAMWWNSGDIRRLLGRLETKKGSLMLLVQALSLHSVQEMQELLQQNMRTLDIARLGLDDMVHSYPAYTAKDLDSTASGIDSGDSMLGDRDSVISNTRFNFDDICFDSKPYRHTVARVAAKRRSHYERRDADGLSSSPLLLATREAEAEGDTTTSHEAPTPIHLTGVPPEEHQAVLMKLREAEALIRTLQGRTQQPGTVSRESPAVSDPSQHPLRVKDDGNELLQDIAPQTAVIGSTKQPQAGDDFLLRPTTKSRRRTALPVEDTPGFRPVRIMVPDKPRITSRLDRKTSSAINEPSAPSDESPVTAGPTRSPGRPRLTHSRKDIGTSTEYFMGTKEKKVEPSIKVHFSPRARSTPQHMTITNLHGETTQTLNADTGGGVASASIPDTQFEDGPKATSRVISAATSLGRPRPWLAANGEEERLIPNAISTIPSCSPLEILERRLSRTKAHVIPEPDVLEGQRALPKLDIEANARQMTPDVKEEAHQVFQYVVPPARPNPPLPLPTDNSFQGPDVSSTKQIQKRAVTTPRPRLGYNRNLHMLDIDRVVNGITENTAHSVSVLSMPTGNGTQAHPRERDISEAKPAKEEEATKKKSVFIRAFKGIRGPSNNLATVEEILGKLLVEVKTLQTEVQQDKEATVVEGR